MNKLTIMLIILGLCVPLWGYMAYKWFKIFNSPDGERYMKRRAQGPFVPLGAEDIAVDDARKG